MKIKQTYVHKDVQFADINPMGYDINKVIEFLSYYKKLANMGMCKKTHPNWQDSKQYHIIGNKMASICKDAELVKVCANILRYQYCNGGNLSQYDLNFVQGVEVMARKGQPFTRSQSWQLAMLLTDHCDF